MWILISWEEWRRCFPGPCLHPRDPHLSLVLQGPWIERDHCTITSACGVVVLRPAQGAHCTVNGREVTASCRLTQGRTVHSPVYAGMSDRPVPVSWARPRELSEAAFKDGTPSPCTQRSEGFLKPSSSHKRRSPNCWPQEWRMTLKFVPVFIIWESL